MGCRLILNLCRVYYEPSDAVRPQSIWAASEGLRFKPPSDGTITTPDWMEEGPSTVSSLTPGSPLTAYELSNRMPLDETKECGEP